MHRVRGTTTDRFPLYNVLFRKMIPYAVDTPVIKRIVFIESYIELTFDTPCWRRSATIVVEKLENMKTECLDDQNAQRALDLLILSFKCALIAKRILTLDPE
jgi:hypothetical protein